MSALYIQVERDGEWLKVTTVPIQQVRYDIEQVRARANAMEAARRQLTGWQSYDGFSGRRLRIAEYVGGFAGSFVEARP